MFCWVVSGKMVAFFGWCVCGNYYTYVMSFCQPCCRQNLSHFVFLVHGYWNSTFERVAVCESVANPQCKCFRIHFVAIVTNN